MIFNINHETDYEFNAEVFLEPHSFRFKLKNTPHIQLESFHLQVEPEPAGISEQMDPENNIVHFCWFEGVHRKLSIQAKLEVDSIDHNPFNFIISPISCTRVPFTYPSPFRDLLIPSMNQEGIANPLFQYGEEILSISNSKTIDFLTNLTRQIHLDFLVQTRETGTPFHPDRTFGQRSGSCRDLAWMEIHLLRKMGLAARFVSGYFYLPDVNPEFELHAWLEVFLPGAGWTGFDPTHGIIAGIHHIPIASSAHFENTMAVSGSVRGSASSTLHTNLAIHVS